MDIYLADPSEIPLPPGEVRIRELRAEPWPDGLRVRVYLETDPSQKRPSADLLIRDPEGAQVAATSIIESVERKMEVVLHLRSAPSAGTYTLHAVLFFAEIEEPDPDQPPKPVERLVVDQAEAAFTLPG
jgi:hypothetical protein